MTVLWLDFETYSECDLKKAGADIYSRHPSTEALMLAWAIDGGPVQVWDIAAEEPAPVQLSLYLSGMYQAIFRAYYAPFEMAILRNVLHMPVDPTHWQDVQVQAYSLSFGGSLDMVLKAVNLEPKEQNGKRLIKLFCKPQKVTKNQPHVRRGMFTDPEDWTNLRIYCRIDVEVMRNLWNFLQGITQIDQSEWDLWYLDQKINERGLPVDIALVQAALAAMASTKFQLQLELASIPGIPDKQRPQPMRAWLGLPNFQKATKEAAVLTEQDPAKRRALELSLQIAQLSSASKWSAFDRRTDKVNRVVRGTLQFVGANRTGRWAGRGVQSHNMKWTTDNQLSDVQEILSGAPVTMDQVSHAVRGAICAPEGKLLVVSDLSGVESRLAGWVCGCKRISNIFVQGKDVYKDLATHIFQVPYDQVTKEQRTFAKPAALGAQYRLGARGLTAYAKGFGVLLSEKKATTHIETYRGLYPEVCDFWYWVQSALESAVGGPIYGMGGRVYSRGPISIIKIKDFIQILLPSGRRLHYYKPYFIERPVPGYPNFIVPQFTYGGMIGPHWSDRDSTSQTVDPQGYLVRGVNAHSGGVLENIIQAIARDVLAIWLRRVDAVGLSIVGHVHDEIICLEEERHATLALEHLNYQAALPIEWAPGLLLTAAGYTAKRYKKD